jgi:predicted TIM-barrel fold metal-dependent hydrolase
MNRRNFLLAPALATLAQDTPPKWPNPVIDVHFHPRPTPEANAAHLDGAGVDRAVLLTNITREADAKAAIAKYPKRFVRFTAMDANKLDIDALRASARGALGLGEFKSHVACDGPEMQRVYALGAELGLPVLLHFAEYEQYPGEGTWNTGFARFAKMLKKYPKTLFIGHADYFWASISAEVPANTPYPTGPVKRGGLSDKLLADHANLVADLSANSCRNALARDPDFSRDFLSRHQDKLMFGSDCSCQNGRGANQKSTQPLIKNKCVARETLTALQQLTTPAVFRKLTLTNAERLLKL